MDSVDPVIGITAQIGVLTVASLLWTLQSLLVWNAAKRPKIAKHLGLFLHGMTLTAAITVALSLSGTVTMPLGGSNAWANGLLISSVASCFILLFVIALYYLAVVGALIDKSRA